MSCRMGAAEDPVCSRFACAVEATEAGKDVGEGLLHVLLVTRWVGRPG